MENLKVGLTFPCFSSASSFLLPLVKNGLKKESKIFSQIFMKVSIEPNFDMENSKIKLTLVKFFIPDFHQNCHTI